MRIRKC